MYLESTAKPEIKMAKFKKDKTQIRKYRQRNKNRNMEKGCTKTKKKDACIQKSY